MPLSTRDDPPGGADAPPAGEGGAEDVEGGEGDDVRLLMARCSLLHAQGHTREFAECAKVVLYSFCREVVDNERMRGAVLDHRKMRRRLQVII